jgi:hypothetical protein
MKGVRVNFSKTGMSLTAGARGASINISQRGTYLNTGIPGTGLYDRTKINPSPSFTSPNPHPLSDDSNNGISITIGIDNGGKYYIKGKNGEVISDESLLMKIKKTEVYKNKIIELSEKFANDMNLETETFVEIYKHSEKIISVLEIQKRLSNLILQKYIKKEFTGRKPNEIDIKYEVESEAKRNIKSIAFWKLKEMRQEYFNREFPLRFQKAVDFFNKSIQEHNENESNLEIEKNEEYLKIFNQEKKSLEDFLEGGKDFVESNLESFLKTMTLPVNFSVSFEYDQECGVLKVDLDLPEIEDLPTSKAATLSSGKIKVKDKSQKEIKEQYLICVTGLSFFFASHFFNISTRIKEILISGFTQRINKKIGQVHDDYIYSVIFNRDKFINIDTKKIVPYLALEEFEHRINYSKVWELMVIKPITEVDKGI